MGILAGKANTSFSNLSGGQRQRLFIFALALINHPEVRLPGRNDDRPSNPLARHVCWDLIKEIPRERVTTVVLVTHFMDEKKAEELCDRLAIRRSW